MAVINRMSCGMSNRNPYNPARSFLVANALAGSVASELAASNRRQSEKMVETYLFNSYYMSEAKLAEKVGQYVFCRNLNAAYEFLNNSLRIEMIHDCQNQTSFTTHLTELMEQRKAKYLPFYQKIDRPMPESLSNLSAEELCSTMGVKLMSPEELMQFHKEMKEKEDARKWAEAAGLVFRAVLIIGLLALVFCVS